MPMFNYQCQECGHYEQDKMVKKWDQEVICPICNNTIEKKPSASNFQIDPAC